MSHSLLQSIIFSINTILPSMVMLILGWFLNRIGRISQEFCNEASKLVFNCAMPVLLFMSIIEGNTSYIEHIELLIGGLAVTFITYALAEIIAIFYIKENKDKGVFVQGVFRGNLGIVGLAFCANAYGSNGVAIGAIYTGVVTISYNILAVITLSRGQTGNIWATLKNIIFKIVTNPLIIAIVAALVLKAIKLQIPSPILKSGVYIGHLALPLALICAGATFNLKSIFKISDISLWSSLGRLIVAPIIAVIVGLAMQLDGISFGILFLMTATPVATASYVMARAMGGNDIAAANIMGITTIGTLLSTTIGIIILNWLGLM